MALVSGWVPKEQLDHARELLAVLTQGAGSPSPDPAHATELEAARIEAAAARMEAAFTRAALVDVEQGARAVAVAQATAARDAARRAEAALPPRSGIREWGGARGQPSAARGTTENPLVRKLGNFTDLSDEDVRLLNYVARDAKYVGARQDLIREGEVPEEVHLILGGIACRYKLLPDGRRQIMAYLVAGDFCDVHVFILRAMDHSIATLSGCEVVAIPRPLMLEMVERPAISRALWWATLVDEATLREWVVNVGRRPSDERIAHLLCELLVRLRTVGLADGSYAFPITQEELGDTVGLSTVHVNRTLQSLRA